MGKAADSCDFITILVIKLDSLDSRSSEKFGAAMANPEKEVMRAAFTGKLAHSKLQLEFTAVQSSEDFESVNSSLDGW